MRISTQMMYEQNLRGVTNAQGKWLGYGEQMTTGQRVNRPSDDPIAASQAVDRTACFAPAPGRSPPPERRRSDHQTAG